MFKFIVSVLISAISVDNIFTKFAYYYKQFNKSPTVSGVVIGSRALLYILVCGVVSRLVNKVFQNII